MEALRHNEERRLYLGLESWAGVRTAVLSMVNCAQISAAQQIGELARVNLVALVAFLHQRVFPRIADYQLRDVWLQ